MDQWYEVGSLIEGFLTTCLFVYLIFHKEKCPHCAAREEINKADREEISRAELEIAREIPGWRRKDL